MKSEPVHPERSGREAGAESKGVACRRSGRGSTPRLRRSAHRERLSASRLCVAVLALALLTQCKGEAPQARLPAVKVRPLEKAAGAAGSRYSATVAPGTRVD